MEHELGSPRKRTYRKKSSKSKQNAGKCKKVKDGPEEDCLEVREPGESRKGGVRLKHCTSQRGFLVSSYDEFQRLV